MKKLFKKLTGLTVAALMVLALPTHALAAVYHMEAGDIVVSKDAGGQYVTQGGVTAKDDAPVITNQDPTTEVDHVIDLISSDGTTIQVTVKDINIVNTTGSAIDVIDETRAVIIVEGQNKIHTESGQAGVHVGDGDLTITGDGQLSVVADMKDSDEPAGIGTNEDEHLSGSIAIEGDVTIIAYQKDGAGDGDGAAIGTGEDGDLIGSITIGGNSHVEATSNDDGAGIGTGRGGEQYGSIVIEDNAEVEARSDYDGAGIGTGERGDMEAGALILITGNAVVEAKSDEDGSGIGCGEDGSMKKDSVVHITGNAKVNAQSEDEGAGIGAGEGDEVMNGTIQIDGDSEIYARSDKDGAGIGAGEESKIGDDGLILIGGNAFVHAVGEDEGTGIGAGEDEDMDGTIIIKDLAHVIAWAGRDAAAIGADDPNDMDGLIKILDRALVELGVADGSGNLIPGRSGVIGGGNDLDHDEFTGDYVVSTGATINGVPGYDVEGLKDLIDMALDEEGNPVNLTLVEPAENDFLFYLVKTLDNGRLGNAEVLDGHVLKIGVEEKSAKVEFQHSMLLTMINNGIETVEFTTLGKTSSFDVSEVYDHMHGGADLVVTHDGAAATLTAWDDDLTELLF